MISRTPPLEGDVTEILEHETEKGVRFERAAEVQDDASQSVLGGLIRADEHVEVRELPGTPEKTKR